LRDKPESRDLIDALVSMEKKTAEPTTHAESLATRHSNPTDPTPNRNTTPD
jgi:hypothetical protein